MKTMEFRSGKKIEYESEEAKSPRQQQTDARPN
jgi:hypothetical protein